MALSLRWMGRRAIGRPISFNMDITIIVVTKNRWEFLRRLLGYYAAMRYPGRFLIGDSSAGEHLIKNRETIAQFERFFPIEFHEFPGEPVAMCHQRLADRITTEFSACISDSGFLTLTGLQRAVDFLKQNPDYVAADGAGALFVLWDRAKVYGAFEAVSESRGVLRSIEDPLASRRLIHYMNPYSVSMYSVYRAKIWQQVWRFADQMQEPNLAGELLPCALTAVYGKTKRLNVLLSVRHMHQGRYLYGKAGLYWLLQPAWGDSFRFFFDVLTKELQRLEGLSEREAQQTVVEASLGYLLPALKKKYTAGVRNERRPMKDVFKRNKWVRGAYDFYRRWFTAVDHISLPKLLKKNSLYHENFMSIYQFVVNGMGREGP